MHVFKPRLRLRRARRRMRTDARSRATAGMFLTFRAELMPGRLALERTYAVARVLSNGRVELVGLGGQHALTEFEPLAH